MPQDYFASYVPLLLHFLLALAIAVAMVVLSTILGKRRYSPVKDQAYECGMDPIGDARERFSVKFYLVAMLFVLFDVEVVFLYPWAIVFRDLGWFGWFEMVIYLGIVLTGFVYIWKKGVLDWSKTYRSETW
jgi:NADH-quinone oxidoreductase subunit A